MTDFLIFLENNYSIIIECVLFVITFVISVLLYKRTGNIKYLEEVLSNMKYKTESSDVEHKTITFPTTKKTYRYNSSTGGLEVDEENFDFQALIQSCVDQSLDAIMSRLMPDGVLNPEAFSAVRNDDPITEGLYDTRQDLMDAQDFLNEISQERAALAEKFGYTTDLGITLDDYIKNLKESTDKAILEHNNKTEVSESEKTKVQNV